MKLLYRTPNTIERDALIRKLKEHCIEAISPEDIDVRSVAIGGMASVNERYSIHVIDDEFERAQKILSDFLESAGS